MTRESREAAYAAELAEIRREERESRISARQSAAEGERLLANVIANLRYIEATFIWLPELPPTYIKFGFFRVMIARDPRLNQVEELTKMIRKTERIIRKYKQQGGLHVT